MGRARRHQGVHQVSVCGRTLQKSPYRPWPAKSSPLRIVLPGSWSAMPCNSGTEATSRPLRVGPAVGRHPPISCSASRRASVQRPVRRSGRASVVWSPTAEPGQEGTCRATCRRCVRRRCCSCIGRQWRVEKAPGYQPARRLPGADQRDGLEYGCGRQITDGLNPPTVVSRTSENGVAADRRVRGQHEAARITRHWTHMANPLGTWWAPPGRYGPPVAASLRGPNHRSLR